MRVLVTGANGLLGSNVAAIGATMNDEVVGTVREASSELPVTTYELDIRDDRRFCEVLDVVEPDVVVNCAAMTDVDLCEREKALAREINARAPRNLAEQCSKRSIDFVHVSTDYVFDGNAQSLYSESSTPHPIQAYGETKLEGDRAVLSAHEDCLIVRLSFVYGIHQGHQKLSGFPAWVRDQLLSESDIPLFTDQWVTPTRAGHAAQTIFDLLDHDVRGTVNVASRSCVTPFEFGELLQKHVPESSSELVESTQDALNRPADRPRYSCLDVDYVETILGRAEPNLSADLEQIASYLRP